MKKKSAANVKTTGFKLTKQNTVQDLAAAMVENYARLLRKTDSVTVVIAGASDKDKNDLICQLFGTNTVNTLSGIPVRDGRAKIYNNDGVPLTIYDVYIPENSVTKDTIDDLLGAPGKDISCILYCVRNFSIHDQKIIRLAHQKMDQSIGIIVVCVENHEGSIQKEKIEALHLPVSGVCTVNLHATDTISANDSVHEGLDVLSFTIHNSLTENTARTYTSLQKTCITLNKQMADKYIAEAIVPAGVGELIPFGKSYLAVQVSMLAGITMSFGLPANKIVATGILCAMAGVTTGTMCLTEWIKDLIGEIPGDSIGMEILKMGLSAGTIAVITYAVGETYKAVLGKLRNETWTYADLHTEKVQKVIRAMFCEQKELKESENSI